MSVFIQNHLLKLLEQKLSEKTLNNSIRCHLPTKDKLLLTFGGWISSGRNYLAHFPSLELSTLQCWVYKLYMESLCVCVCGQPGRVSPLCERVDGAWAWSSQQRPCRTLRKRAHGVRGCGDASSWPSYPWTSLCSPEGAKKQLIRCFAARFRFSLLMHA